MSLCEKKIVTCSKCSSQYETVIWESINVSVDPEERGKILDGSFFKSQCRTCGNTVEMVYSCLYHDMERKQMFYLIPNYKPEKVDEINHVMNQLPVKGSAMETGYTMRIVGSANSLAEKIRIFDAGRDDRIIEICKLYILHNLKGLHPEIVPAEIYYHFQEREQFIVFTEDGGALSAGMPEGLYDLVVKHMEGYLEPLECRYYAIDREWATAFGDSQ